MANLFWRDKKTDKEVAIKKFMEVLPDYTPSAFKVKQEGDDTKAFNFRRYYLQMSNESED